jgi:hypothetical protein
MDNVNDHDALGVNPVAAMTAIGHGISGNVHGLLSSLKHSGVARKSRPHPTVTRAGAARDSLFRKAIPS